MTVRAKFKLNEKTERSYVNGTTLKFGAVYSQDPNHENKRFWDATPVANLEMTIKNEAAAQYFELGKEYYLDFIEAPDS